MSRIPKIGDIVWFGEPGPRPSFVASAFGVPAGHPPPPSALPAMVMKVHDPLVPNSNLDLWVFRSTEAQLWPTNDVPYSSPLADRTWCWPK